MNDDKGVELETFLGGAARRGGNWNNGSRGGAFTMNLNNSPSDTNTNIGFRCVFLAAGRLGPKDQVKEVFLISLLKLSMPPFSIKRVVRGTPALFLGPLLGESATLSKQSPKPHIHIKQNGRRLKSVSQPSTAVLCKVHWFYSASNSDAFIGFRCVFFAAGRLERKNRVKDIQTQEVWVTFLLNGEFLKALQFFSWAHCKRGVPPFTESESIIISYFNWKKVVILFSGGAALRGGRWNNGSQGGAFTLNLNNSPSNTNSNVGFRCVFLAAGRLERKKRVKDAYEIYQRPLFSFNGKFLKALRLFSGAHCKRGFFISPFAESESMNSNGEESTISFGCGAARRGGNWNNGSIGGAFTMNLNNSPSNTSTNIGFRCVFPPPADLGNKQVTEAKSSMLMATSLFYKNRRTPRHLDSSPGPNTGGIFIPSVESKLFPKIPIALFKPSLCHSAGQF